MLEENLEEYEEYYERENRGGPAEIRTLDPQLARLVLYQLSYRPTIFTYVPSQTLHESLPTAKLA